jgi:hypothetical protein
MGEILDMKKLLITTAIAAAFAAPAFAQGAAELVCGEYGALDNAGKMAIVAELESLNAETASTLTSAEIEETLASNCTEHPEMLVIDVI